MMMCDAISDLRDALIDAGFAPDAIKASSALLSLSVDCTTLWFTAIGNGRKFAIRDHGIAFPILSGPFGSRPSEAVKIAVGRRDMASTPADGILTDGRSA